MTKLYITLLFTVTFFNSSYAQWAYNGNHIVNQNSGYVGIGTNVPATPLEVQGSSNGWLLNLRAIAANAGEINGIKFNSGYLADSKWAGISSVAEDVHSNNTGLLLYANATERMRIQGNGDIGIGTNAPNAKLAIFQAAELGNAARTSKLILTVSGAVGTGNNFQHNTWLSRNENGNDWLSAVLHDGISIDDSYLIPSVDTRTWWERNPEGNIQSWGDKQNTYMTLNNGNVSIGTKDSKGYKLAVNGKIHTNEVRVDMDVWPDYVFNNDYKLPLLSEVESFINKNHHLPAMPSEAEVKTQGIQLGEMNKILVQKVEELTLYLIEKDKKDKEQELVNQSVLQDLKKQNLENQALRLLISGLQKQINELAGNK